MTIRSFQPIPFRKNLLLKAMLIWLAIFWVITAIEPYNRRDWLLENILVFVYMLLLALTYRKFTFSNTSYGLFTLFLTLHLIGAHYTYAQTPFGFWLQDLLSMERNHYDRIVHFAYGLLAAYPFREILIRAAKVRTDWSYFISVNLVIAFSGFYEVIEGAVAVVVSPDLGNLYLGTQGDEWDAQHDMFMAFSGALVAMVATWRAAHGPLRRRSMRKPRGA